MPDISALFQHLADDARSVFADFIPFVFGTGAGFIDRVVEDIADQLREAADAHKSACWACRRL